jgi:hypothetical protein
LMQILRQPKQWMLRVLIIPRWVSHEMFPFWGIFPRDIKFSPAHLACSLVRPRRPR